MPMIMLSEPCQHVDTRSRVRDKSKLQYTVNEPWATDLFISNYKVVGKVFVTEIFCTKVNITCDLYLYSYD